MKPFETLKAVANVKLMIAVVCSSRYGAVQYWVRRLKSVLCAMCCGVMRCSAVSDARHAPIRSLTFPFSDDEFRVVDDAVEPHWSTSPFPALCLLSRIIVSLAPIQLQLVSAFCSGDDSSTKVTCPPTAFPSSDSPDYSLHRPPKTTFPGLLLLPVSSYIRVRRVFSSPAAASILDPALRRFINSAIHPVIPSDRTMIITGLRV